MFRWYYSRLILKSAKSAIIIHLIKFIQYKNTLHIPLEHTYFLINGK